MNEEQGATRTGDAGGSDNSTSEDRAASLMTLVGDLAVDLWRIKRRAERHDPPSDRVLTACELAMDRLLAAGFTVDELLGEPYDESMRVRVVEREGQGDSWIISECLAPAVYSRSVLIRTAEVVLRSK
jgi:hypothetical protein